MSLDFSEFLNIDQHQKKIEHGAQEIREKYAPRPAITKPYIYDLFEFFYGYTKNVANEIYNEILHEKDKPGSNLKFTSTDLRLCIKGSTQALLPVYIRIISTIRMGGMFRDFDNADNEITSFKEKAEALSKKQSEILETEYIKLLEKNRREYLTYVGAVVGGIASIISLIPTKVTAVVIKSGQYIFSMLPR